MTQAPLPPPAGAEAETETSRAGASALLYAIYGAIMADFGCVIGAAAFLILIILSAVFAPQITPCTSAGGIPCAH
jgi:hypothetical protein